MSTRALRTVERASALEPAGLVAVGDVVAPLIALLRRRFAGARPGLSIVAAADLLVVLGGAERLPWVDGVVYIASDPDDAALFLPTTRALNVPASWAREALHAQLHGPLLLLDARVVPLRNARLLDDDVLAGLDVLVAP